MKRLIQRTEAIGEVPAGLTDVEKTVPSGKTIHVKSITFAHSDNGSGVSGEFMVQWGFSGSWETVCLASLTGATAHYQVQRDFIGDGIKKFRFRRNNLTSVNRRMHIIIEAYLK